MRPHENLEAWRKSLDFVVEIYKATESFPKEEKFGLTSQIRQDAVSLPANIELRATKKRRRAQRRPRLQAVSFRAKNYRVGRRSLKPQCRVAHQVETA